MADYEWQPIETVPLTKEVRLWGSLEGRGAFQEIIAFPSDGCWRQLYTARKVLSQTHWRPLAEGPNND